MSIASARVPNGPADDLQIGEWRLAVRRNELRRGNEVAHLEPKATEVLAYLAGRAGEVVSREELLAAVWPGVVVGDDALTQAIIKLRKALGDDAHAPRYIETISKRGYRLAAPVSQPAAAPRRPSRRRWSLLAGGGAIVVTALAALWLARPNAMPWPLAPDPMKRVASAPPVVAVLPFTNLSGDSAREYFSDGLTEDIITGLGRFSGVRVMSYGAVQGFKGKALAPQAVREELGSRYVVRGSVRDRGETLGVSVELADTDKGMALWSERFEGEGRQLFEIQDRIVQRIVGSLHVRLTQLEIERASARPAGNLDAYDLTLRARALIWRQDRRSNIEARDLLSRVLATQPNDGEALVLLGNAEAERAIFGWIEEAEEGMLRAEKLGRRALTSPDTRAHPRAHSLLSMVYSNTGRYAESIEQADRALALNPSDSVALFRRGSALLFTGRIDPAIEALEAARRMQPRLSAGASATYVQAYYVLGRYRDAASLAETQLLRHPRDVMLRALHAAALAQLGELEGARQSAELIRRLNPGFQVHHFGTRFQEAKHTTKLQEGLIKAGLQ